MSKKFYPVLSITLIVLSVVLGYVATSDVLSNKSDTAQNSHVSKSVLVTSSGSNEAQETSSSLSNQDSSASAQVQPSTTNSSVSSVSSIEAAVDDGWVLVEPSSPSSDANQIRG